MVIRFVNITTFVFLLSLSLCLSRKASYEDSVLNLEDLNPYDYVFKPDYKIDASYGWFPKPTINFYNLALDFQTGDIYDIAHDIRPSGFVTTNSSFTGSNLISRNERKIMRKNENNETDDDYPATSYESYGLNFRFTPYIPLIFRIHAILSINDGMLFSVDESRSFLNLSGSKQNFKEAGIAYISEITLNSGINLIIPVYGAFANIEVPLQSYYYLSLGVSGAYVVSSDLTQYSQIADAKESLRYSNGQDTINLMKRERLSDLNKFRYYADVGIGWELDIYKIGIGLEAYVSLPMNSVVTDEQWKQYIIGLRMSVNFLGFFNL